ncbi:unnamed protein product [Symbiodinium natans]|uniref:Uncharacterized protein n=1 Tax=Symbiodinium natans TaxID=878477 RepID=A0A812JFE8_9DINO|nr:unnamed protein product [Symbiodinium natans]
MEAMVEVMLGLGKLILEYVQHKSSVGLHGYELEENYARQEATIPAAAVTCYILKMLKDKFPEDMSDQNSELLSNDEKFAETVSSFLSSYDLNPEADVASASEWYGLCQSYAADAEAAPDRYWVLNPVDTTWTQCVIMNSQIGIDSGCYRRSSAVTMASSCASQSMRGCAR